jgi:hypothetical protein
MRDHNETHEPPEHREHPNDKHRLTFSPWGGDNLEPPKEHPCDPQPLDITTPELVLMGDAFWGWSRVWSRA